MKLLFCNYEYPPLGGGGGVINALLAEELAKNHQVSVLSSGGMGLEKESIQNGVRVFRVPVYFRRQFAAANFPSMLAYIVNGRRFGAELMEKEKFDIINTHFALPSGPVGDYLSERFSIPNILSVHGGDLYDPSKFTSPHKHYVLRKWVKKLLKSAEAVVGQSENTISNVRRYYSTQVKTGLIPLGIKRPRLQSGNRGDYGFSNSDVVWITIGRLVGRKATDKLIKVMSYLSNPNVKLVVIGSGPLERELKAMTANYGLTDKVHFSGYIEEEEKYKLLDIADGFISTSQHEGFGLVFLEAMAAALPVICYDFGGQTDFLEEGKTGYLVPLNNELEMQKRWDLLTDSAIDRKAMGQYNSKKVIQYFIENCATQYETLYDYTLNTVRH